MSSTATWWTGTSSHGYPVWILYESPWKIYTGIGLRASHELVQQTLCSFSNSLQKNLFAIDPILPISQTLPRLAHSMVSKGWPVFLKDMEHDERHACKGLSKSLKELEPSFYFLLGFTPFFFDRLDPKPHRIEVVQEALLDLAELLYYTDLNSVRSACGFSVEDPWLQVINNKKSSEIRDLSTHGDGEGEASLLTTASEEGAGAGTGAGAGVRETASRDSTPAVSE